MRLRIKVNTKSVLKAFLKFPEEFSREVRPAMKEQMVGVQREARAHHRFTTRSGMAERSISTDVKQSGLSGRVFLDTGVALYGPALHEGQGSRSPDRFLNAALDNRRTLIEEGLEAAVARGIKKAGF